jgi:hypothetical protein
MKVFIIIIAIFLGSCATVDERIKEYSYTTMKYNKKGSLYQVYQTKKGSYYIIELNDNETKFKRTYLKIK